MGQRAHPRRLSGKEQTMSEIDAVLAPSGRATSIRQELLPQDARDLAAYAFSVGLPVSGVLPIPVTAMEIEVEGAVTNMLEGGDGFRQHGGCDSLEYFTHADDPGWAVVFAWDCDGDAARGKELLEKEKEGR
jgi:hypothetical protein